MREMRGKTKSKKTFPMDNPQRWLHESRGLLIAARRSREAGDIPEATFRSAYPAAEKAIKAASPRYRKDHHLSKPLTLLKKDGFGPAYLELRGTTPDANEITPQLIGLAREVEKLWPPYGNHIEISGDERDKVLRLAEELDRIIQPEESREEGG